MQSVIQSQNYHLSVFDNIHVWVCFQIQLSVLVVCNLLLISGIQIGEKSKPYRLMMFSKCTICVDSLYFLYMLLAPIWRILMMCCATLHSKQTMFLSLFFLRTVILEILWVVIRNYEWMMQASDTKKWCIQSNNAVLMWVIFRDQKRWKNCWENSVYGNNG